MMHPAPLTPADKKRTIQEILTHLKTGRSFCLSGHKNPDADVIGSELALASLIRRLGGKKKIDIQNAGSVPRSLLYLPGAHDIQNVEKVQDRYDVTVVHECSGEERMGNIIDLRQQGGTVINIDHHLHNPHFGNINLVDPVTSSTSELVFQMFEEAGEKCTPDEAVCLFSGLVADTGWFRYGNTNPQSLDIARKLLEVGVPVADIAERLYMSRSQQAVKLLGWILSNMKLRFDNRVAVLSLPTKIFKEFEAQADDLDEIVNQGLLIHTVKISVFLKELTNPPSVKVSLRSKNAYDINRVAKKFRGGGHKNASGCQINASLDEAEKLILEEIQKGF